MSARAIKRGELICDYHGDLVSDIEGDQRYNTMYRDNPNKKMFTCTSCTSTVLVGVQAAQTNVGLRAGSLINH